MRYKEEIQKERVNSITEWVKKRGVREREINVWEIEREREKVDREEEENRKSGWKVRHKEDR